MIGGLRKHDDISRLPEISRTTKGCWSTVKQSAAKLLTNTPRKKRAPIKVPRQRGLRVLYVVYELKWLLHVLCFTQNTHTKCRWFGSP